MKRVYSKYHNLYGYVSFEDWRDLQQGYAKSIPVAFGKFTQSVPKGYLIEA